MCMYIVIYRGLSRRGCTPSDRSRAKVKHRHVSSTRQYMLPRSERCTRPYATDQSTNTTPNLMFGEIQTVAWFSKSGVPSFHSVNPSSRFKILPRLTVAAAPGLAGKQLSAPSSTASQRLALAVSSLLPTSEPSFSWLYGSHGHAVFGSYTS